MAGLNGTPLRIGVSSCLLGVRVRFDGGHKRNDFLTEVLGPHVEWVPVCPEVEMGLGAPRDTLRLERHADGIHMVMPKTGQDHTQAMRAYAARRVDELATEELSGYVLKKDSPSCGMERVRVFSGEGVPERTGRGLFAEQLLESNPLLPVEDEGRLNDARIRENFVERIFAYRRLRSLFRAPWTISDVIAFHTAHKLTLLAHSPDDYRALGRLVAHAKDVDRAELRTRYETAFMGAMTRIATPCKHANVLHHILGYFSDELDDGSRRELLGAIEDHRNEIVPLVVPLTLVRHYVRLHDVEYLKGQTYLETHPEEMSLRNAV